MTIMPFKRTLTSLVLAAGASSLLVTARADNAIAAGSDPKILARIQSFCSHKEGEARAMAKDLNIKVAPEIWKCFDALNQGNWVAASNLFEQLKCRSSKYKGSQDDQTVGTPVWQPLLESILAYEHVVLGEPKYAEARMVDSHVRVTGQIAVMAVNALLTKVVFEKNPEHEFYVEESFPLDWMYPHLAPHAAQSDERAAKKDYPCRRAV